MKHKIKMFEGQNNAVFNLYTPFRNTIRKTKITPSLRAIHANIQHMLFGQPVPPYIIHAPIGYSSNFFKSTMDYLNYHVFPWELEVIAKELIIHGAVVGVEKTLEDWNHLVTVINKLKALENDIAKIYSNTRNVLVELHRIAHRQFIWQNKPGLEDIARYWKIYSDPKLNKIILNATGLSLDEVYLLALALTGFYLDKYALDYPPNINVKNIQQDHYDKFLNHFSLPFDVLQEKLKKEQQMNEKYAYAFNSLRAYPLIRMEYEGRDSMVCPLPPLLFRRITEGLYYEICNEPDFDIAFGEAFQTFIGELIRRSNSKVQVIPEKTYGKPEKRTVDWITIDSSALLFIECKGKRLTLNAKINLTDTTELEHQLDLMADFIVQIYKTIIEYQNNKYSHIKFDKNKPVYPVLVTLEDWFIFGDKLLEILNPKIQSKLKDLNIPLTILESNPYTVCSVEGLTLLLQISAIHSIKTVISGKNINSEVAMWQMENYLRNQYKDDLLKLKFLFKNEFSNHVDYKL